MKVKYKTLERLAQSYPECLPVHLDIKQLMPEADALLFERHGFKDCSWGNDECPSYFKEHGTHKMDTLTLMVVDNVDDNYNRIDDTLIYVICNPFIEHGSFASLADAIKYYEVLLAEDVGGTGINDLAKSDKREEVSHG